MKILALHDVQLHGHVYRRGEVADYCGAVDARIAANFAAADGSPLSPDSAEKDASPDGKDAPPDGELPLGKPPLDEDALVKRTLDTLKREGVMRQLDDMGITYPANAKSTFLARLLLMGKGEIKSGE